MLNISSDFRPLLFQVPRMFQRRVSAFGVRNQQDSTFSLTSEAGEDTELQFQSLTGSRRASAHQQPGFRQPDQSEAQYQSLTGTRRASVSQQPDQSEAGRSSANQHRDQSEAQYQSLTGSRRASVRVHAPPGGISSGFW